MVARILRPSARAIGRGADVSAEVGRIFWPSEADAVARHSTRKMNRPIILQVSQTAAKAALAMPRRRHRSTVQVPFFFAVGWRKIDKKLQGRKLKKPLRTPLVLRRLADSRGCRGDAQGRGPAAAGSEGSKHKVPAAYHLKQPSLTDPLHLRQQSL